ncbi:MAG: 4Fe-4S binding protein [Lachnospiraceae bacterium]|nr:4Fe-4S binding protein [Lachnospiraceae bacterium]
MKRKFIQLITAILCNAHLTGFYTGKIYQGNLKAACVPGLNCYSCPGAIGSCPLGSLQSALVSSKYRFNYYILGVLILMGAILGRVICGFLCPFGLLQELIYKLPTKKLKKNKITRILSYFKYIVLIVFVIILPLISLSPAFCKYICPQGTLEGGILLVKLNDNLKSLTGGLYNYKVAVMTLIIVACIFIYRMFCRFVCPLGAIYALFSPIAILGIKVDKNACDHCNACVKICKMDIKHPGDSECIHCGECINVCHVNAIEYAKFVNKNKKLKQEN